MNTFVEQESLGTEDEDPTYVLSPEQKQQIW